MKYLYHRIKFRRGDQFYSEYEIGHEHGSVDGSDFNIDLISVFKGEGGGLKSLAERVRGSQAQQTPQDLSFKNLDYARTVLRIISGRKEISLIRPLTKREMLIFATGLSKAS